MARDILDLGADVFDDLAEQKKHRISPKKRNYIIGLSITGLFLVGMIVLTIVACNSWLLDVTNLTNIQFIYTPKDENDPDAAEPTLTLYQLDPNTVYPSTFRIPERVQGYKVTAIGTEAFNNHSEIEKVIFTSYVDTVGDRAFIGCRNLKEFEWNDALVNIGVDAFDTTAFYDGLKADPKGVFAIPSGVLIYFGDEVFNDNTALVGENFTEEDRARIKADYGILDENIREFATLGQDGRSVSSFVAGLFNGNPKITYIDFPAFLTKLGSNTFANCANLKEIDFSNSKLTNVADSVFDGCTSLSKIIFSKEGEESKITSLGKRAFANTAITALPDLSSINTFGEGVFEDCKSLVKVYYPNSKKLTKVPDGMFSNCTSLTNFHWEDDENSGGEYIENIGKNAFTNTAIKEFFIPKNVMTIHDGAFSGCTQLKDLYFYGNPYDIYDERTIAKDEYGVYAYENIEAKGTFDLDNFDTELAISLGEEDFNVAPNEEGNYVFEIIDPSEEILVPSATFTLTNENFNMIKNDIVSRRPSDSDIQTDDSSSSESEDEKEDEPLYVMVQDDTKFFAITFERDAGSDLYYVYLKSTATYTVDDDGNYHLGYLAGVSDIRKDAFKDCRKLDTIYLYGEEGYDDVYTDEYVLSLPKSLTWMSKSSRNLGDSLNIFQKTAAKKVEIGSHIRKIGGYSFSEMPNLEEVAFAEHSALYYIGEEAFSRNDNLKTISIPSSVRNLEPAVFADCPNLETIDIKDTSISILKASMFENCNSLKHIDIPETVEEIDGNVFYNTYSLDYVVVPASLNTIVAGAFKKCSLSIENKMPIYFNMTYESFMGRSSISKKCYDDTCEPFFLLEDGEEKVEGVNYWNGNGSDPHAI